MKLVMIALSLVVVYGAPITCAPWTSDALRVSRDVVSAEQERLLQNIESAAQSQVAAVRWHAVIFGRVMAACAGSDTNSDAQRAGIAEGVSARVEQEFRTG